MKIQNKELSWPNSPRPNSGSLKWIILSLSLQSLNWKIGDWLITLKLIRTFVNRGYLEQIHKTVFSVCCTGWWLPCTITTDWIGGAWPSLAHSLLLNWGGASNFQLNLTSNKNILSVACHILNWRRLILSFVYGVYLFNYLKKQGVINAQLMLATTFCWRKKSSDQFSFSKRTLWTYIYEL